MEGGSPNYYFYVSRAYYMTPVRSCWALVNITGEIATPETQTVAIIMHTFTTHWGWSHPSLG